MEKTTREPMRHQDMNFSSSSAASRTVFPARKSILTSIMTKMDAPTTPRSKIREKKKLCAPGQGSMNLAKPPTPVPMPMELLRYSKPFSQNSSRVSMDMLATAAEDIVLCSPNPSPVIMDTAISIASIRTKTRGIMYHDLLRRKGTAVIRKPRPSTRLPMPPLDPVKNTPKIMKRMNTDRATVLRARALYMRENPTNMKKLRMLDAWFTGAKPPGRPSSLANTRKSFTSPIRSIVSEPQDQYETVS